jgi:hypothetical protein
MANNKEGWGARQSCRPYVPIEGRQGANYMVVAKVPITASL